MTRDKRHPRRHRPAKDANKPQLGASRNSAKGSVCAYCGKRSYFTRKYAREAMKILYPGERMSAYQCPKAPDWVDSSRLWHVGHLHDKVLEDGESRLEFYTGRGLQMPQRDTVTIKDNDDQEEGTMPTIGEMAHVRLQDFDRHAKQWKSVTLKSPMVDKVALVHGALRAHALTHSFDADEYDGKPGYVGRVAFKQVVRELFEHEVSKPEQLDVFAKAIQNASDRAGLTSCLDSSQRMQGVKPIWWIADSYESVMGRPAEPSQPEPKTAAAEPGPAITVKRRPNPGKGKKRKRRPPQSTIDRMYRVKAVLEDVGLRYGTALSYAEIQNELGGTASYNQVETAVDLLVSEKQAHTRAMSAEDKAAIRAAGGDAPAASPGCSWPCPRPWSRARSPSCSAHSTSSRRPRPRRRPRRATTAPRSPRGSRTTTRQPRSSPRPWWPAGRPWRRSPTSFTDQEEDARLSGRFEDLLEKYRKLEAENAKLKKRISGLLAVVQTMED